MRTPLTLSLLADEFPRGPSAGRWRLISANNLRHPCVIGAAHVKAHETFLFSMRIAHNEKSKRRLPSGNACGNMKMHSTEVVQDVKVEQQPTQETTHNSFCTTDIAQSIVEIAKQPCRATPSRGHRNDLLTRKGSIWRSKQTSLPSEGASFPTEKCKLISLNMRSVLIPKLGSV